MKGSANEETQARHAFLEPFFRAPGWIVAEAQGLSDVETAVGEVGGNA